MFIDLSEYPLLSKFEDPETIVRGWIDTQYLMLQSHNDSQPSIQLITTVNEACSTMKDISSTVSKDIDNTMQEIKSTLRSLSAEQTGIMKEMQENMNKLPILLSNSSKKGKLGEKCLTEYLDEVLSKEEYNIHDTAGIAKSGDRIITKRDFTCMIDSKNYSKNVPSKEIEKLERDMIERGIQAGILISFDSGITGYTNLDFKFFKHNDSYSCIAIIGKARDNPQKIEVSIRILESIYDSFLKQERSQPIVNDKTESILKLVLKEAEELSSICDIFENQSKQIETSLKTARNDMNRIIIKHQQTIKTILEIL